MKMKVEEKTQKKASVELSQNMLRKLLKSLGCPIDEDTQIRVTQANPWGSKEQHPVQLTWDQGEILTEHEVRLVDEEDINFFAGMADMLKPDSEPPEETCEESSSTNPEQTSE